MIPERQKPALAAHTTLIILQAVMLGALFTKTVPHPPELVAPFGIGPFLGVSISLAVAALIFDPLENMTGRLLTGAAAICALISYGPQKYLDPAFPQIWPAVLAGQIAAIVLGVTLVRNRRNAR